MSLAIAVITFVAVSALIVAAGEYWFARRKSILERLSEIRKMAGEKREEDALQLPFWERVVKPAFHSAGNRLGSLAPREIRARVEKKLLYAGDSWNITFNGLVALQLLAGAVFLALSLVIFGMMQMGGSRIFFLTLVMTLMGAYLPMLILNSKVNARQMKIQKELPDMLDLLLVSVEAGLGFDMALQRVADQMPGTLSREFTRALEEVRMGKTREEALRGISARTGVADLNSFISSVIQAEQLGSNIANTLRVQAGSMRQKRRQRVEEIAMKAPVKMLFPLIFFVFPALFVVILGPALIRIFQMLMEM